MYDPTICTDTDCEWIELYNNGTSPLDISSWKINGNDFDDVIILPNEFIIIARKLTDSLGGTSFEAIYGNNDSIWNSLDSQYKALDGNFQLGNTAGNILLSSSNTTSNLSYTSSIGGNGNGKSIVKNDLNNDSMQTWQEGMINGTPGYSEFLASNNTPQLLTLVNITNAPPSILSVIVTPDDSPLPGIQLAPAPFSNITLSLLVNTTDSNGVSDIISASAIFQNQVFPLTKIQFVNEISFIATFSIGSLSSGFYNLTIIVNDTSSSTELIIPIEILQILTISINQTTLDFGQIQPDTTSNPVSLSIINTGTTSTDIEITASDLISNQQLISATDLTTIYNSQPYTLSSQPTTIPVDLSPGNVADLLFTLHPSFGTQKSAYLGILTIAAIAS